jgi:hypothetical protein
MGRRGHFSSHLILAYFSFPCMYTTRVQVLINQKNDGKLYLQLINNRSSIN